MQEWSKPRPPKYLAVNELLPSPGSVTVKLGRKDSVDDPASTKRRIWGPAIVILTRHADGGIDAKVS